MRPTVVLLVVLLFASNWAGAQTLHNCENNLGASPALLGQAAVELFLKSEEALAIAIQLDGNSQRPVDMALSQELTAMIQRLASLPGDHQKYVGIFRELANVLAGAMPVSNYTRRAEVGYRRGEAFKDSAWHWNKLEDESKYLPIKPGWKLKVSGGLLRGANIESRQAEPWEKFAAELLQDHLGEVMTGVDHGRTNSSFKVGHIRVMSFLPGPIPQLYVLEGYRIQRTSDAKNRRVIREIRRPTLKEQSLYLAALAARLKMSDSVVKLPRRLHGAGELFIPAGVRLKLEKKHGLDVAAVMGVVSKLDSSSFTSQGLHHEYFVTIVRVGDHDLKIVLKESAKNFDRLELITAFYLADVNEAESLNE